MVSSPLKSVASSPLIGQLRSTGTAANRSKSSAFGDELKAASAPATKDSPARANASGRQVLATSRIGRQDLVDTEPVRNPARVMPAREQQPTAVVQPRESTDTRHPSVIALHDALQAAGIPTTGLQFEYTDQLVGYPGGAYQNRLITVTFPGGVRENFGADLVMRNPRVAAVEIQNLLTRRA